MNFCQEYYPLHNIHLFQSTLHLYGIWCIHWSTPSPISSKQFVLYIKQDCNRGCGCGHASREATIMIVIRVNEDSISVKIMAKPTIFLSNIGKSAWTPMLNNYFSFSAYDFGTTSVTISVSSSHIVQISQANSNHLLNICLLLLVRNQLMHPLHVQMLTLLHLVNHSYWFWSLLQYARY